MAAAAALIAKKGWEATTAAEISRRAGYSRAMVHARFGGKDAILDTLFRDAYDQRLSPALYPDTSGLDQALAFFDRIHELLTNEPDFLHAMFVMGFEAAKKSSPLRPRMQEWLKRGADNVRAGLRYGIRDGSVRPDIEIDRAVDDISAAVFGVAYQWVVRQNHYDLERELMYVRTRLAESYGHNARRPRSDRRGE